MLYGESVWCLYVNSISEFDVLCVCAVCLALGCGVVLYILDTLMFTKVFSHSMMIICQICSKKCIFEFLLFA